MRAADTFPSWIASFGRRKGRPLRPEQKQLLETSYPDYEFDIDQDDDIDPVKLFADNVNDVWFEIGFGKGEHLSAQADKNRNVGFIGCETYINGIVSMLQHIDKKTHTNIRLSHQDARLILEHISDASLGKVFILFPDPWPKKKHIKRRLIDQSFLDLLARKMKDGAELRVATDHSEYANWALHHMLNHYDFAWIAASKKDWQHAPDDWVATRYQAKAEKEGRYATYLRFVRNRRTTC